MKPFGFAIALATLVIGFSVAVLAEPVQNPVGSIQGTVVHTATSEPIPNVQITLATGPVDNLAAQALRIAGSNAGAFFRPNTSEGDAVLLISLTENATSQGMSLLSPDLVTAMNNYRDQTAKFKATTDSRGQFTIAEVPAGQYSIRAARDGYYGTMVSLVSVSPSQLSRVSFSLLPGAIIGGRVIGDSGEALAGADVSAYALVYQNGVRVLRPAVTAKTNFRGEYRLFWLTPGEYFIGATDTELQLENPAVTFSPNTPDPALATALQVKPGDNLDGVNIEVRPARRVKIAGKVSVSGPVAPFDPQRPTARQVMLSLRPRDANTAVVGAPISTGTTLVGPNAGNFEIQAPPGGYELSALVYGLPEPIVANSPMGGMALGRIPVDVADRDLAVTVTAIPEVKVTGVVTVDGAPAQDRIAVSLISEKPVDLQIRRPSADLPGVFTTTVYPGNWVRPSVQGLPSDVYIAEVRKDGVNVFDTGFEASATSENSIQILTLSGGGKVEGLVRDGLGRPVPSAVVALVPPESRRQNRLAYKFVRSNVSGKFSMTGIEPGEYKLLAWENFAGDYFTDSRFLAKYESKAATVTVAKSATITADLSAIPAGQ